MDVEPLSISDILLLRPKKHGDARGFFSETFNAERFAAAGAPTAWVQDNHSYSAESGVVRGLHFQAPPKAQAKIVRVLKGAIYDVAVDIRRGSPTYGRWVGAELSAENWTQIYVPRGMLHGFCTLTPDVEVLYKVDAPYAPELEGAVRWDDPDLAIDWPIRAEEARLSAKDAAAPAFRDFDSPFMFGETA